MTEVVLVVHLLVCIALIGCVLLQRSEGGALGMGGGGAGALFSSRGVGNVLTRTTALLAVAFFATSITLSILARGTRAPTSVFEGVKTEQGTQPDKKGDESVLPQLPPAQKDTGPQVPTNQ
jgi:preprotein translocase subunit SecG